MSASSGSGEATHTPTIPYLCPGDCATWVADPRYPCLDCWTRENPLPAHIARRFPDHPRSRTP